MESFIANLSPPITATSKTNRLLSSIIFDNKTISNEKSTQFSPAILRNRTKTSCSKFKPQPNRTYLSFSAKLIGLKALENTKETIYHTEEPTKRVMEAYNKQKKCGKGKLFSSFKVSSPGVYVNVDKDFNFTIINTSNKQVVGQFDVKHISAYGSHAHYLNIFSIIVVDSLFNFVPTCLVFKFSSIEQRFEMVEDFLVALNRIQTKINGVFVFDDQEIDLVD